jgi:hypothetical protein
MDEMQQWKESLKQATHIRPRKWCGVWILHSYNRNYPMPHLYSIADSEEAYQAARDAGVSLEEPLA